MKYLHIFYLIFAIWAFFTSNSVYAQTSQNKQPLDTPEIGSSLKSGWQICNQSNVNEIRVAYVAQNKDGKWFKNGWLSVYQNSCTTLLSKINTQYVYYYGKGSSVTWEGKEGSYKFCVNTMSEFSSLLHEKCPEDYETFRFVEVNTKRFGKHTTILN